MNVLDKTTQMMAAKLPDITPALAAAPEERVHKKARRSFWVVIGGLLGLALLLGGAWLDYGFAKAAIEQKQVVSVGLMLSLGLPLVPATVVGAFVLLRFDNDAGGILTQLVNVIGAFRRAVSGAPPAVVVSPPPEAGQ